MKNGELSNSRLSLNLLADITISQTTREGSSKISNRSLVRLWSRIISSHNSLFFVSSSIGVAQYELNFWFKSLPVKVPLMMFCRGIWLTMVSLIFCLCNLVLISLIVWFNNNESLGLSIRLRLSILAVDGPENVPQLLPYGSPGLRWLNRWFLGLDNL